MHTPPTPQSSLSSLFSPPMATSSSQENRNDGASTENRLQPLPDPYSSPARPKPRKASKAAGPKRQRGLSIAKLERLRLQKLWKKITEVDPAHEIPVYDYPAAVTPLAGYAAPPPAPPAVAAYGGWCSQAPGMCYAQRCLPVSPGLAGYGGGAVSVRPILCEQYSLDRCRLGMGGWEGRFQVGSPFPEPPSNQKMQCFSDQCEFCARESQSLHGCGQRRGKSMTKSSEVVKEFDFFPQSRSASSSSSSCSSGAASSSFVDLSLKLSI